VSRKRKKPSRNPAKIAQVREAAESAMGEFTHAMRSLGEDALERARQAVLDAGATEEQVDQLMRMARARIAWEALEIGQVQVFEWVMAPVANELELLDQLYDKAVELKLPELAGEELPDER
jgi:hypothetical protein